jgi:hypothetical protein
VKRLIGQHTNAIPSRMAGSELLAAALIGTVLTQSTVSIKTALRKPFYGMYLRRAVFDERRGQDSNLRTGYPVTGLANPRFRPLSHLSRLSLMYFNRAYRRRA